MFSKILKRLLPLHKKVGVNQDSEWSEAKIEKMTPITREVIEYINECQFPYSSKDNWEEVAPAIRDTVKKILELYLKENIRLDDMRLISLLIRTQIERIFQSLDDSLNKSSELIEEALYGCPKRDLDFDTLDKILREAQDIKDELKTDK